MSHMQELLLWTSRSALRESLNTRPIMVDQRLLLRTAPALELACDSCWLMRRSWCSPDLRSIARLFEPAQIGWQLAVACRHQQAFAAEEIILLADPDLMFILAANCFQPRRGLADIFAPDGPWLG